MKITETTEITVAKDGQTLGPYTLAKLRKYVESGTFNSDDVAWFEGLEEWHPIKTILDEHSSQNKAPPITAEEIDSFPRSLTDLQEDEFWKSNFAGRNFKCLAVIDDLNSSDSQGPLQNDPEEIFGCFVPIKFSSDGRKERYDNFVGIFAFFPQSERQHLLSFKANEVVKVSGVLGDSKDDDGGAGISLYKPKIKKIATIKETTKTGSSSYEKYIIIACVIMVIFFILIAFLANS